jgi:hypothetical protein
MDVNPVVPLTALPPYLIERGAAFVVLYCHPGRRVTVSDRM